MKTSAPPLTTRQAATFLYMSKVLTIMAPALANSGYAEESLDESAQFRLTAGVLSLAIAWFCKMSICILQSTVTAAGPDMAAAMDLMFCSTPVLIRKNGALASLMAVQRGSSKQVSLSIRTCHPITGVSMRGRTLSSLRWSFESPGGVLHTLCPYQFMALFHQQLSTAPLKYGRGLPLSASHTFMLSDTKGNVPVGHGERGMLTYPNTMGRDNAFVRDVEVLLANEDFVKQLQDHAAAVFSCLEESYVKLLKHVPQEQLPAAAAAADPTTDDSIDLDAQALLEVTNTPPRGKGARARRKPARYNHSV